MRFSTGFMHEPGKAAKPGFKATTAGEAGRDRQAHTVCSCCSVVSYLGEPPRLRITFLFCRSRNGC